MSEEIFEIVDEEGNVLRTEKRGIAHRTGLLHKGIHGFVLNGKKEVFIQKRSLNKLIGQDKWDASIAEHLKPGEKFEEAFVRGVKEELDVKVKNIQKLGEIRPHFKAKGFDDNEIVQIFKSEFEGKIKLLEEEVAKGKWIAKEELLKEMDENPEIFTQWLLGDRKFVEML